MTIRLLTGARRRLMTAALVLAALGVTDTAAGQVLDRSRRPAPAEQPPLTLPAIEKHTLSNGIEIAFMRDTRLPVVSVSAVFDLSPAVDPADKIGLGDLTVAMLSEGTTQRTADELAEAAAALGGGVSATSVYTIMPSLDSALALMADQLLNPAFPEAALDRLKANALASIRRQQESPGYLASTVFERVVFGVDHPYARQRSEASVEAIARDDLLAFHRTYLRPPNVSFVVVGDVTADEAVAKLEAHFGGWTAGASGRIEIPAPPAPAATTIYLYDRPASPQSVIRIGTLGPRRDTPDYHALTLMNTVLGESFSSRINMNLREEHGYTYGARSRFTFRRVPEVGTFAASAAVQSAKTDSSVIEFMRELRGIRDGMPLTAEEFRFAQAQLTKELPLRFETVRQRAAAIATLLRDNLPLDYYETLSADLAAVTRAQAQATAEKYVTPDAFAIVVVGDRASIEADLRATGVAPVVVVDLEGKPAAGP